MKGAFYGFSWIFMKILTLTFCLLVLISSKDYLKNNKIDKIEYPIIVLSATLGMMIMISSNDASKYPVDNFEKMQERHRDKKFNFPYLYDESQEVAKMYGAERTPEVFVFDSKGLLRYTGAIDDNYENESEVKSKYLEDALKSLIKGNKVIVEATDAVGCTIKWK